MRMLANITYTREGNMTRALYSQWWTEVGPESRRCSRAYTKWDIQHDPVIVIDLILSNQ